MRRVFVSCLGIGSKKAEGHFDYDAACYFMGEGEPSNKTKFVQVAELQLLGASSFDKIVIVATEKAKNRHYDELQAELEQLGIPMENILCPLVDEDMTSKGQWAWFEKILEHIQPRDRLTVDLTHGYRAIPIVFSTAIHFLQRARSISIEHVFYGAYDKNRELSPIVDMKDFYLINEWAEGVSRLVEDADARKIVALVTAAPSFQVEDLRDDAFAGAAEDLTNRIRNVDMHNMSNAARNLLDLVRRKKPAKSTAGEILLQLVAEKYESLTPGVPATGRYDRSYFAGQLAYIKLLLEHKLYMQAFTVMREVIGSIGLIGIPKARTNSADGRRSRGKAEVFVNMLQIEEKEWQFPETHSKMKEDLLPFYGQLKACGIEAFLRSFLRQLVDYRNGFDHGWTKKPRAAPDLVAQGEKFHQNLVKAVSDLEACGILLD